MGDWNKEKLTNKKDSKEHKNSRYKQQPLG